MRYVFDSKFLDKKEVGEGIFEVILEISEDFEFKPGQYVWVVLPELKYDDKKGERRAFSIISPNAEGGKIAVLFRRSESGYKKTFLGLKPGSELQVLGPFGSAYVVDVRLDKKINLIAGGVGVAPFLSLLRGHKSDFVGKNFRLIYVNSSDEMVAYLDELSEISKKTGMIFNHFTGGVNDKIFDMQGVDFSKDFFFVCGPKGFVDTAYDILNRKGAGKERVHFEQYYPDPDGNLREEDFMQIDGVKNVMLQAVKDSKNHVIVTDANGVIIFANKTAQKNTGFSFDEMRGQTPRLWGGLMSVDFYHGLWNQKHASEGFDGELVNRRKNGEIYHVIAHISPIVNESDLVIGYIGTEEDITERLKLQNELQAKVEELEKFSDLTMGREIRMIELKDEVDTLLGELGREPKYHGDIENS